MHVDWLDDMGFEAGCARPLVIGRLVVPGHCHEHWWHAVPDDPPTSCRASSYPSISGSPRSSNAASGLNLFCHCERGRAIECHPRIVPDGLERFSNETGTVHVVVDDEHPVASAYGLEMAPATLGPSVLLVSPVYDGSRMMNSLPFPTPGSAPLPCRHEARPGS